MWPALLFPVVVLAGTLLMERFETALIGPKTGRVRRAASRAGRSDKNPLWTVVTPRDNPASGLVTTSLAAPEMLPPLRDRAELEVASGAVTG